MAAGRVARRVVTVAALTVVVTVVAAVVGQSVLFPPLSTVRAPAPMPAWSTQAEPATGSVPAGSVIAFAADARTRIRCTVGPAWTLDDGTAGVLTAGHCAARGAGATILDGAMFAPAGTVSASVQTTRVDVAFVELPASATGTAVIRPGASALHARVPGDIPVTGTVEPAEGMRVCTLGVTTGLLCRWRVSMLMSRFSPKETTLSDGVLALGTADVCVSPGDSGGPVFTFTDGTAHLVGVVSASAVRDALPGAFVASDCLMLFTPLSQVTAVLGGRPVVDGRQSR